MSPRWAKFRWPSQFRLSPRELDDRAGLVARKQGDGWRVITRESYGHSQPQLLTIGPVITPDSPFGPRAADTLAGWETLTVDGEEEADSLARAEIDRLLHVRDENAPSLEEYLEAARLVFLVETPEHLQELIAQRIPLSFSQSMGSYAIRLMTLSSSVQWRLTFAKGLFHAEHASEALTDAAFEGFSAMSGLLGGGLQAQPTLLHPFLGAHAPWMYGAAASRPPNGLALFLFEPLVPGRQPVLHPDLLQSLTTSHLTADPLIRFPATPSLSLTDVLEAATWWANGLNRLIARVLDPTLFADHDGWYLPSAHLAWITSFERLLASVISSLVHSFSDEYTRRIHLFEALDLLEGLGLGGYDQTVNPLRLRESVEALRRAMPIGTQRVLLPRCDSAVKAAAVLKEGFRASRIQGGRLTTLDKRGHTLELDLDAAASSYVRVVRNARHSLSQEMRKPRSLSLLSAHDGNLPSRLSDIAFLHLVRLVADPDLLRGVTPGSSEAAKKDP